MLFTVDFTINYSQTALNFVSTPQAMTKRLFSYFYWVLSPVVDFFLIQIPVKH